MILDRAHRCLAVRGRLAAAPAGQRLVVQQEPAAPTADHEWIPLARALVSDDAAWALYTDELLGGFRPRRRDLDAFHLGADPASAARLAHAVVTGDLRTGAPHGEPGRLAVLTDWFGYPACVVETTDARGGFRLARVLGPRVASEAAVLAERQLVAYNAGDIDAFMACYHADVEAFDARTGALLLRGRETMRERYAALFAQSPTLHCELVSRLPVGPLVVDVERVTGRAGSDEPREVTATYEVEDGAIRRVWFMR